MSFLDAVRGQKEREVAHLKAHPAPERRPWDAVRPFADTLRGSRGIIAEVKATSPSRPDFRNPSSPGNLARWYARSGAVAMSVVTDAANFGTSLDDLATMRRAAPLSVISKDFIIDPVQIRAAWAAGADAVLLIARMLDDADLRAFLAEVHALGLDALVECHDGREIERALTAGARVVGINNRDLSTLETDIARSERLLPRIPGDVVRVSESGLERRADIERLAGRGADAFLVGHALLLSGDPGRKVRELNGREDEDRVRVKICGLTTPEDAALCAAEGADLLGVIFAESPRRIGVDRARAIRVAAPYARLVGVFMDQDASLVAQTAAACDLDLIQLHGSESPEYLREVRRLTGRPLIKALTPGQIGDDTVRRYDEARYFLLDQPKAGGAAATGDPDWLEAAAALAAQGAELFLAGGLDSGTGSAPGGVRPFAIDICRAVEAAPGRKDPGRVHRFFQEVIR